MTNFEKYKKEILHIAKNNAKMAVSTKSLKPQYCIDTECTQCLFPSEACDTALIEWFYQEYQDPAPKLTKAERGFCEIVKTGYIARNSDGSLYTYKEFPSKNDFEWGSIIGRRRIKTSSYSFITWESGKVWSIEDLLKLEVEE